MIKVSQWLKQYDTHDILNDAEARKDFKTKTCENATWSKGYTTNEIKQLMRRPCDHINKCDENVRHKPMQEIAVHCVYKYISENTPIKSTGMGSIVRECIELLENNGI